MTTPSSQAETKVRMLHTQIRDLAYQRGPGSKLPTVRELCQMFQTSRVSLYEALDDLEAQNILYREQSRGIFVSQKIYRKSICIVLDTSLLLRTSASPFWGMLWGHFAAVTQQRSQIKDEYYTMHLISRVPGNDTQLPEEIERLIQTECIHGVLAVGFPAAFNEHIMSRGVPCVTFAEGGNWMVGLNMIEVLRLGVKCLTEQGCQQIGLWNTTFWQGDSNVAVPSYDGLFASFLQTYRQTFHPDLIQSIYKLSAAQSSLPFQTFQEQGYQLALQVFTNPALPKPDGIVSTDDMMTDGLLAAFQTLGIRVGEDVKIATHANKSSMMLFKHMRGMTVIEFDPEDIVHAMFSMLDQLLVGQTPSQRVIEIAPSLLSRS
ncbi:GntR family transcriptional regulator [Dictyobacter kobayashii]|uniref:HTH gntR-type domain-containing protein n=1 Tax=Dictyobacter kobayashii TaxID=2014872 RepID=A0A402ASS8_9CHLR|nr:substrate-binding domain-containing protein [Dictyobacter kobayashii]GCE22178.1 hypothetical protein KDK_59780 [Dictyobacter kobayashii]